MPARVFAAGTGSTCGGNTSQSVCVAVNHDHTVSHSPCMVGSGALEHDVLGPPALGVYSALLAVHRQAALFPIVVMPIQSGTAFPVASSAGAF